MSRGQAEELIKRKQGKLCGLIYLRKDGSIMISDCPVGLAAIRKRIAKRIAALATIPLTILSGVALFLHQTKNSSHVDELGVSRLHKEEIKQQLPDLQKEQLRSLGYISLE
jgi:hypothetical protein